MLTELDQKIRNQENMFYKLPLCNLPTLKRIVEDVGFDDIDMLEGMINHSKKAIEEAIDSNLDDKEEGCEHVWTFILRMYRLLKRINHEARLAAGLEYDDAIHIHIPAEPGEDGFEAALDAALEDAGVMSAEPNEDGKEECDE
ncbi:MAG: hypothetical protein J5644_03825 [Bacteroidales bacterium]|nr:hypothetical protein [Bacteroidales bacterium]